MAIQDFNISNIFQVLIDYTVPSGIDVMGSPLSLGPVEIVNDDNLGSPISMGSVQLVNLDNYGSPATFIVDSLRTDTFGSPLNFNASGLAQNILSDNIIYRNTVGHIDADVLDLNGTLRPVQLSGVIRTRNYGLVLNNQDASGVLNSTSSRSVNINSAASGPIKLSLPSGSPIGTNFQFIRTGAQEFRIDTQNSETIRYSSGNAVEISLGASSNISLVYDGSGNWISNKERGVIPKVTSQSYSPAVANPSGVSGLILWLDSSDSSTITLVGSGISTWADKSTNGNDYTQSTAANRPIVDSGVINGLDAIKFIRSSATTLTRGTLVTGPPFTVFVVAELFNFGDSADYFSIVDQSSSQDYFRLGTLSTPLLTFDARDASVGRASSANIPVLNERHIAMGQEINTGSRRVKFNNFAAGTNTDTITPDAIDGSAVGSLFDATPGLYLDGRMFEVLVYDRVLTALEETQVINYLASKWDVAL